jgi:hypothetical protein
VNRNDFALLTLKKPAMLKFFKNNLKHDDHNNLAVTGQFGIRQVVTGATSNTNEKFMTIKSQGESTFTCDVGGGGDPILTFTLQDGDNVPGAFTNVRDVTGHLKCFKSELKNK